MFGQFQYTIILIIAIVTLIAAAWGLIEALRAPAQAYVAAGKRTKLFWGSIMGVALLIAFLTLPPPLGIGHGVLSIFSLVALVAIIMFFVDVRPKIKEHNRRGPTNTQRGGW